MGKWEKREKKKKLNYFIIVLSSSPIQQCKYLMAAMFPEYIYFDLLSRPPPLKLIVYRAIIMIRLIAFGACEDASS